VNSDVCPVRVAASEQCVIGVDQIAREAISDVQSVRDLCRDRMLPILRAV